MPNKTERINLRVTETEFDLVDALALAARKTKSAYLLYLVKNDAALKLERLPNDGMQDRSSE